MIIITNEGTSCCTYLYKRGKKIFPLGIKCTSIKVSITYSKQVKMFFKNQKRGGKTASALPRKPAVLTTTTKLNENFKNHVFDDKLGIIKENCH